MEELENHDGRPFEEACYGPECERVSPENERELADIVRGAEATLRPVVPAGAGTRAWLGSPPPRGALIVSLERFASVRAYEPGDFTIGVEAGFPLAELRRILAANGQEIAVHIPESDRGRVGGLVAAGWPAPRLARNGPLRSSVIGVRGLRGGGRTYKAGGMVVKNVAGYEVAKLAVGSLGAAGFILSTNFKLRPLPHHRRLGRAIVSSLRVAWDIVRRMRRERLDLASLAVLDARASRRFWTASAPRAAAVSPIDGDDVHEVLWLAEGNRGLAEFLDERARSLASEAAGVESFEREVADAFLDASVRFDQPESPADGALVLRLSLLSGSLEKISRWLETTASALETPRPLVGVEANSGQVVARFPESTAKAIEIVRTVEREVAELGGRGWVVWAPPEIRGMLPFLIGAGEEESPERILARRILAVFDSRGIFSPGRLWPRTASSSSNELVSS